MHKNNILKIGIFLILSLVIFSCKKNSPEFNISGELENVKGTYFFAAYEKGDSLVVDTVNINTKGEFHLKGLVDTLTIVRMYFNQNTKTPDLYVFADKKWDVKLKGDVSYPDLIMVKGGDVNDDLTAFKTKNYDLLMNRAKILEAVSKDFSSTKDDQKYIMDLKNVNFELLNITASYIKNNPDKIASVVLINTFFKDDTSLPRLDEALNQLRGKAETFPLTTDLRDYSEKTKRTIAGSYAPNFTLNDVNGKTTTLYQFRGKYLLLSFVSTTCDICNQQRKNFVKVYDQLKKEKVEVNFATVIIDTEEEPLTRAVKDSIKWSLLPEKGSWAAKTFELYNIREVPYNILIDPKGMIVDRDIPIDAIPNRLNELLKVIDEKDKKQK